MATDPFEDILDLEEQFYQEGYKQGQEDGVTAGRSEGRSLGLEKGFQKFAEAGMLFGKAIVWANRLPAVKAGQAANDASKAEAESTAASTGETKPNETHGSSQEFNLPSLPRNARLEKHITTLYALVEADTLSTENTDEAVNDFDDRIKRAQGRAKMIERIVGEGQTAKAKPQAPGSPSKGVSSVLVV
ncbi:DUF1715 domain containing protein [Naviculisporaceae sp. PSN 640]